MQLDFKSYTGIRPSEFHPHMQIVLAVEGGMEIEIGGKGGRLGTDQCALVPTGVAHSQCADSKNKFLVVNCLETEIGDPRADYLAERVFLPVSPAIKQLIAFAEAAQNEGMAQDAFSRHWARLLVASLSSSAPSTSRTRLTKLATLVENSLDQPWTVREMAAEAGLSPSRFHTVFQEKMQKTPQEWLADLRMEKARQWLAGTDIPIAELAQRAGYSDQSALTRAMRRVTGQTPAAYRKQQQDTQSKKQE